MILYKKILEIYDKKDLKRLFGVTIAGRIVRNEKLVALDYISRNIDFQIINYTYNDFLIDYEEKYKNHVEKKMLFNIFKAGYSPELLKKEFNAESAVYNYLKYGFYYEGTSRNIHKTMEIMGIKVDISKFNLDIYDSHIELFGAKEDLEIFKTKYNIKREVLFEPYKQNWHLAFNGCLAEYIKMKQEP